MRSEWGVVHKLEAELVPGAKVCRSDGSAILPAEDKFRKYRFHFPKFMDCTEPDQRRAHQNNCLRGARSTSHQFVKLSKICLMTQIGIFPQNIRNSFRVKQETKMLTRTE
jgi:hypothetical protein